MPAFWEHLLANPLRYIQEIIKECICVSRGLKIQMFSNILQGGLFNCPPPKMSKCWPVRKFFQKKIEYSDCPPPKISKCETGKENSN